MSDTQKTPNQKLAIGIGAGALILTFVIGGILGTVVAQNHPNKPIEPETPSVSDDPVVTPVTPTQTKHVTTYFSYFDEFIPGATYTISMDADTNKLSVAVVHSSSTVDSSYYSNRREVHTTTLSDAEYDLIMDIFVAKLGTRYVSNSVASSNVETMNEIVTGIQAIAQDDEEYCVEEDLYCPIEWDTDGDDAVTMREFGVGYLESYLEDATDQQ